MIKKLYYKLTYFLPRPIPKTEYDYEKFKDILIQYFGVKNDPKSWMTVAGQITSTPSEKMYKSWGKIANCAKRLDINKLAHDHKTQAIKDLNELLKKAFEAEQERLKKEEDEKENKEGISQDHGQSNEGQSQACEDEKGTSDEALEEIGIGIENPYI